MCEINAGGWWEGGEVFQGLTGGSPISCCLESSDAGFGGSDLPLSLGAGTDAAELFL